MVNVFGRPASPVAAAGNMFVGEARRVFGGEDMRVVLGAGDRMRLGD